MLKGAGVLFEKGVDVLMAMEILQIALDDRIDLAVLITGDGDFVPLVRAVMKRGKRVMVLYFEYQTEKHSQRVNKKLHSACNYPIGLH